MKTFLSTAVIDYELILCKPTVETGNLLPMTNTVIRIVKVIWESVTDKPFVLTSCLDGVHKQNSLHYRGLAFDIRLDDLNSEELRDFLMYCDLYTSRYIQVIVEVDHIHIELDKK